MAIVSENQYEPPVKSSPNSRPMISPLLPPRSAPMPTNSAASKVSMKVVLTALRHATMMAADSPEKRPRTGWMPGSSLSQS